MDESQELQSDQTQLGLFAPASNSKSTNGTKNANAPLAYRARPSDFEFFFGQKHIFKRYPYLKSDNIPAIIIWGPPGSGKTTLAQILAKQSEKEFFTFNAVLGGINDLKKIIKSAEEIKITQAKHSIIFIDEIHRFNKAQQDALLPYVENGSFLLIGATTENPRSAINRALLSRMQVVELKRLESDELCEILKAAGEKFNISIEDKSLHFIADHSNGDARLALNILDLCSNEKSITLEHVKQLVLENSRNYDKNQSRHYDIISAFIKSMRGSEPDAALLWLAVMIDGGEDPVFIARRLVIFASEDIGNADPQALQTAVACLTAVQNIGMPEARINLAQATTYLAATVKSNAAYKAIDAALEYVREQETIDTPDYLKNHPPKDAKHVYLYPHSYPHHFVEQKYSRETLPKFYKPTEMGREKNIKQRLKELWKK